MSKYKRIFIVGHMGAGKSLLSKALAEKLGWQYVDVNLGLERYIGRPLQEILGKQGEEAFHHCEADILTHYIGKENVVVTLDDAALATQKNRELLSDQCVIYLKVTTPTQIKRMADGPKPLLPIADQAAFLDKLHTERDSQFEGIATFTIQSKTIEDDVNEVIRSIGK